MSQCRDSSCGKLPLEADHDVNEDQHQRDHQRQGATFLELITHLWADKLNATQVDLLAARFQSCTQPLANFIAIAFLWRQSNQHHFFRSKTLYLGVRVSIARKIAANRLHIRGFLIADFEQNTARKIDTELKSVLPAMQMTR